MTPLLIATTNTGKLRENREVLGGLNVPIRSLNDVPPVPEPEETETTFAANALLKARAYAAATGVDEKINILLRSSLEVLTSFGDGGRGPGQVFGVHNLATDSKGNLYATDTYTGARVQRFLYKGVGPVTKAEQGVAWPARR